MKKIISFHPLGLVSWLWMIACVPCLAFGAPLRLECEVEGQMLPFAGWGKDSLLAHQGEKLVSVPEFTTWHLVGDLRENMGLVRWAPRQQLKIQPLAEFNGFQEVTKAEIGVDAVEDEADNKLTLSDWPKATPAECALVTVWLIKGEANKVIVRPLKPAGKKGFARSCLFLLSPAEAQGQPALLLWSNGEFLPPVPEFTDEPTQRAFVSTIADDLDGLKSAVAAGAKLKKKSRTGASLSHYAAMANAAGALEFLIQNNPAAAKVNDKFEGDDPMRWAVLTGRITTMQTLLKAGVSPKTHGNSDGPLGAAINSGHTEVVRQLLQAGAPPQNVHGSNPLSDAIVFGYTEMAEILMKAGGKHDFKSLGTQWNLVQNAGGGCESMVRFLLDHGVDPNSTEFVPEPRTESITLQTPRGPVEIPPEKAPVKPPESGVTALMKAAESGSFQTAATLLTHGAKPNLQTSEGVTALHFAADANSAATVGLLLAQHANYSIRNKAGLSPLDVALLDEASDAADTLAQAGARITLHDANTQKLLECAIREDNSDAISGAIADGWSPNSKINNACPALVLARLFGAKACQAVLLSAGAVDADVDSFQLVKVTELDTAPKPIKTEMPSNMRLQTRSETVRVEFILNSEGQPIFIHVLESPDRHLTTATLRAMENWRFSPPTKSGKPVQVRLVVPIVYKATKDRRNEEISLGVPVILRTVRPGYPLVVGPLRIRGRVWINLLVKADGSISDIKVESSTDPRFESCALQALKDYRFGPRMTGGEAVDSRLLFAIDVIPPR